VDYALGRVAPMQEQERLISEYDHGDCQWITLNIMAQWGSFRALAAFRVRTFGGKVAGLHTHHVY